MIYKYLEDNQIFLVNGSWDHVSVLLRSFSLSSYSICLPPLKHIIHPFGKYLLIIYFVCYMILIAVKKKKTIKNWTKLRKSSSSGRLHKAFTFWIFRSLLTMRNYKSGIILQAPIWSLSLCSLWFCFLIKQSGSWTFEQKYVVLARSEYNSRF